MDIGDHRVVMTKKELIKALELFDDDSCVVCMDENRGWDNIQDVKMDGSSISIIFGGGSPFSDE
ncbi:MAG: hypothetical protein ACYC5G_02230 [Candidatus Doudnabacteria bacterium]